MNELQSVIGYTFKNQKLLLTALTHSSYANEHGCESYERLEFVGDAVLGLAAAKYLYTCHPGLSEGEMTRKRAEMVCEKNLYKCACSLNMGEYLRLGRGELASGGRSRVSILADTVESTIAAIYLDSGFERAEQFIRDRIFSHYDIDDPDNNPDYKTRFQELAQRNGAADIEYAEVSESGPDHNKVFEFCVKLDGVVRGTGKGSTKKEAEQQAAKSALETLN